MRDLPLVSSLALRTLAAAGLSGLLLLTVLDNGATRMFAWPWTAVLSGVVAAPFLALACASQSKTFRLPATPWLVWVLGCAGATLASAALSPHRAPSLFVAAVPLGGLALFLVLQSWLAEDPSRRRAIIARTLALFAGAIALVSVAGWLRDLAAFTREEIFSPALFAMRNPHPLGHSNYTAGLMLLGLPWLIGAVLAPSRATRFIAAAGAGLALFALVTSGSRGGILGLATLGLVTAVRFGPNPRRIAVLVAGVLVGVALLVLVNDRLRTMMWPASRDAAPNISTVQRRAMLEVGARMGRDRPLLGWGPGTTPHVYPRYRHAVAGGADTVLQLHSLPVQLWAEGGISGICLFMVGAGLLLANTRREPVAAATLAGYGVFALTDAQLDLPIFTAAIAALAALLASSAPAPASAATRRITALGSLAVLALIGIGGGREPAPGLNVEALQIAARARDHGRAVELLRNSLGLDPDQEIAHFNLGWLLVVADPAAAEKHFRAAIQLVPDKGGAYFGLGLACLNQGQTRAAAHALALECINDPRFLASPWWKEPAIRALRDATRREFLALLQDLRPRAGAEPDWRQLQAEAVASLVDRLGETSPGPEHTYRRERTAYPVLMRNSDLPAPVDLYDVREDPRFAASLAFPLPPKGWLPAPTLLKLLDAPPVAVP